MRESGSSSSPVSTAPPKQKADFIMLVEETCSGFSSPPNWKVLGKKHRDRGKAMNNE